MPRTLVFSSFLLLLLAAGCGRERSTPLPAASEIDSGGMEGLDPAGDPTVDPPEDPTPGLGEDPSSGAGEDLSGDPQVEDFLRRAEIFARLFVERAPTAEETERAIEAGNDSFVRLLGRSPEEATGIMDELREKSEVVLRDHPRLAAEVEELQRRGDPVCDPWELVQAAGKLQQARAAGGLPSLKEDRMKCRVFPYVAALIVCAATGNPVFYTACGFVAMCTFCSGGLAGSICNFGF